MLFKRLLERLPKKKTKEELDEHFTKMEQVELEKGDLPAMLIAALISIVLPLVVVLGGFYSVVYLLFVR